MIGIFVSIIGMIIAIVCVGLLVWSWINKRNDVQFLLPMWIGIAIMWIGRLITMLEKL